MSHKKLLWANKEIILQRLCTRKAILGMLEGLDWQQCPSTVHTRYFFLESGKFIFSNGKLNSGGKFDFLFSSSISL